MTRQLVILMSWIAAHAHIDPMAGIGGPRNIYYRSTASPGATVELKSPPRTAADTALLEFGIFPFSAGYGLATNRVEVQLVTFGQMLEYQSNDALAASDFHSDHWRDPNFVIIPILSTEQVQDPEYMSARIIANLRHPFVIPIANGSRTGMTQVDSKGTVYQDPTPNDAEAPITQSAFHAIVDGAQPTSGVGVVRVLLVMVDAATRPGANFKFIVNIGTTVNQLPVETDDPPPAAVNIGTQLYDWTVVGGQAAARSCTQVLRHICRHVASAECITQAVNWFAGVTPLLGSPAQKQVNDNMNSTVGIARTVVGNDPSWPDGNSTNVASAPTIDTVTFGTTPIGALYHKTIVAVSLTADVLGVPPTHSHAQIAAPDWRVDCALWLGFLTLVKPNKFRYFPDINSVALRRLQWFGGAKIAAAFDRAAEAMGLTGDIWYNQSGTGTGYAMRNKLEVVADPDFCGILSFQPVYPSLTHTQAVVTVNDLTTPNRVPVWEYDPACLSEKIHLSTGSKSIKPISVGITGVNPFYMLLAGLLRNGSLASQGWNEAYDAGIRNYALTGSAGAGVPVTSLATLSDRQGTAQQAVVASWFFNAWDQSVWETALNLPRKGQYPDFDTPVGNMQPWANFEFNGVQSNARQMYLYATKALVGYWETGGPVPENYVMPRPPGAARFSSSYYLLEGSIDPFSSSELEELRSGAGKVDAAGVDTFQDPGTDVAGGQE
jgi:hypothetical protein